MSVLEGSQYFTTHPPVLMTPSAPVDPVCARDHREYPKETARWNSLHMFTSLRRENQQKEALAVDPLLSHALTFKRQAVCFEHSDLLTVTSVGVPYGAFDSERASTHQLRWLQQATAPTR